MTAHPQKNRRAAGCLDRRPLRTLVPAGAARSYCRRAL